MSNFKKNHWCVVIHFLKKEGLKPSEAAKKLQLHYGDSAPDISIISCWLSRFAAYRVFGRCSALTTAMIHTNIDLEKSLLDGDRRTAYAELGK